MTNDEIIEDVILKEGGATATNDPLDPGGRTQYGLSERANPSVWLDGKVTREEALGVYLAKYVVQPGFDQVENEPLRHLLVDFGVLSGPGMAIKALQRALGLKADGILGPDTLSKLKAAPDARRLHNQVVIERCLSLAKLVQAKPSQARFIVGWLNRSLSFIR